MSKVKATISHHTLSSNPCIPLNVLQPNLIKSSLWSLSLYAQPHPSFSSFGVLEGGTDYFWGSLSALLFSVHCCTFL